MKSSLIGRWVYCYALTGLILLFIPALCDAMPDGSSVKGIVRNEKNENIAGVSVTVTNAKTQFNAGVQTDSSGVFSFSNLPPGNGYSFTISSVGYESQTLSGYQLKPGATLSVIVKLKEVTAALNDVVVVGYGTSRRKDLTGAVASVKGKDLVTQGVNSVEKSLQGRLPGVAVESAGGDPGSGTRILIRGVGTLGNATPLYIVDGIPVASISNLLPGDIESIDVLKDASAAAIYGSRAANGVVLISTKTGKTGKTQINFAGNYGLQKIARTLDVLDAQQWAEVSNQAHDAAGLPRLDIAKNPEQLGKGTDWQKEIFRTAPVQSYEMNISGGSDQTKYSISGGYLDQQGIVKVTGYSRYNLRIRSETTKGKFKIGETVLLSKENWNRIPSSGGNPVGGAAKSIPVFEVYDPTALGGFSGAYGPVVNIINPVAQLNLIKTKNETNSVLLNLYAEYGITKDLKYKFNVGHTLASGTGYNYTQRYQVGALFSNPTNVLNESQDQSKMLLLENTLNYDKTFGRHKLQVLVGYTMQKNSYRFWSESNNNLPDGLDVQDAGSGTASVGGNRIESALLSQLGRIVYGYDNRFLFTGSFRRDGSSRFGKNNRYGNFPSLAAGWNLSEEKFFTPLSKVFDAFKLRVSYGELGNQEIADYAYIPTIASNANYAIGTDQHKWFGAIQQAFADPNIKWENTKTVDIGIDAALFNNKLNITADYFKKKSTDVLLNVPIPGSVGSVSNPVTNAGSIENHGVEVGASYTDRINKFKYTIGATASVIRNKVLSLGEGNQPIYGGQPTQNGASTTVTGVGGPVTAFKLIQTNGIFNSQEEVDNYLGKNGQKIQPNAAPGDIRFVDANGDGKIDDNDRVYCGSPFPKLEYGVNFAASWNNFDAAVVVQGMYGNSIYNAFRQELESMSYEFNYSTATLNAWTSNNHSNIPRAIISDPNVNDRTSARFLESGAYVRLKSLQLGYNFSPALLQRAHISSLRAYISCDNLFTITSYKGYNPDIGRTGSIFDRGVDFVFVSYPLPRVVSFGIQMSF
ncbi:SusC/RagA family TonB-linked outer membrane protein [Deminuibacter soli]|uniref:TonB-dependent receptor n=1 Tax=Deminuibacter soli TaxID=2291815 RepID=A0A3E1NDX4_9BACT|nr:TonB-dependent receptor [Deminuibacter soli]RFM26169.1 TonB-dependent receptor [Deminuibacter soli]